MSLRERETYLTPTESRTKGGRYLEVILDGWQRYVFAFQQQWNIHTHSKMDPAPVNFFKINKTIRNVQKLFFKMTIIMLSSVKIRSHLCRPAALKGSLGIMGQYRQFLEDLWEFGGSWTIVKGEIKKKTVYASYFVLVYWNSLEITGF